MSARLLKKTLAVLSADTSLESVSHQNKLAAKKEVLRAKKQLAKEKAQLHAAQQRKSKNLRFFAATAKPTQQSEVLMQEMNHRPVTSMALHATNGKGSMPMQKGTTNRAWGMQHDLSTRSAMWPKCQESCQRPVVRMSSHWGHACSMTGRCCCSYTRHLPRASIGQCHSHVSLHMSFQSTFQSPCSAHALNSTPQHHSPSQAGPHVSRLAVASSSSLKPTTDTTTTDSPSPAATTHTMHTSILSARGVSFHPPGAPAPLLDSINMEVPPNSLGLIIGRSGSGKTTLLQVLAGLCEQTSGTIHVASTSMLNRDQSRTASPSLPAKSSSTNGTSANPSRGTKFAARMAAENRQVRPPSPPKEPSSNGTGQTGTGQLLHGQGAVPGHVTTMEDRMSKVGLVFQFPERHFLGSDVFSELTFSWPRDRTYFLQQQLLRARVMQVLQAVRLADIDMSMAPWSLSGGQQRRLALAIQLIRQPSVLLLDEPFAGLDWQARQEVVELLHQLKKQCTLLVVSHDLSEVSPLVDVAWVMRPGGRMEQLDSWPPPGGMEQLRTGTPG